MKLKLGETFKKARLAKGYTQIQIASEVGISQPYYNLIENNKTARPPSFYIIEKLARVLECDSRPLMKAVELLQLEHKRMEVGKIERRLGEETTQFSSFPRDTGGSQFKTEEQDPDAFILKAEDDCMSPEIKKEDLLLIYPNEKVEDGDIAVIKNNKGKKKIRRVTFQPNQVILTAENSACPVIVWREEDGPKVIGRVKEIIRRR